MRRNATTAIAILLCSVMIGAIVIQERCRLGDLDWEVCGWLGLPIVPIGRVP